MMSTGSGAFMARPRWSRRLSVQLEARDIVARARRQVDRLAAEHQLRGGGIADHQADRQRAVEAHAFARQHGARQQHLAAARRALRSRTPRVVRSCTRPAAAAAASEPRGLRRRRREHGLAATGRDAGASTAAGCLGHADAAAGPPARRLGRSPARGTGAGAAMAATGSAAATTAAAAAGNRRPARATSSASAGQDQRPDRRAGQPRGSSRPAGRGRARSGHRCRAPAPAAPAAAAGPAPGAASIFSVRQTVCASARVKVASGSSSQRSFSSASSLRGATLIAAASAAMCRPCFSRAACSSAPALAPCRRGGLSHRSGPVRTAAVSVDCGKRSRSWRP